MRKTIRKTADRTSTAWDLHGCRVAVPDEWQCETVYRFIAPPRNELSAGLKLAKPPVQLRSNLLVTRHRLSPGMSVESLVLPPDHANDPTFEVLRSGSARYGGRPATWVDTRQHPEGVNVPVMQRRIAVRTGDDLAVLVVVTADKVGLEEMSAAIGFAPDRATAPPGPRPRRGG